MEGPTEDAPLEGSTGDAQLEERVPKKPDPGKDRVAARAKAPSTEEVADDPETQSRVILEDSDARTEDPASRTLEDDRVERRTSDEATRPADS